MKLFRPQHGSLDNRQYALNQGARTDKCWTVRINLEVERTFLALEVLLLLQLFIFIAYFSTVVPITSCVLFPIGLSSLYATFSTGLEVSSVSWLWQLTVGVKITAYFNC